MASCQTKRWVSTSPYVKLTVTENTAASDGYTAALSWELQYIADYAASTSVAKAYTVKIGGATVKDSNFSINGKTGTHTVASGTYNVEKGTSAQSVAFEVYFTFGLTWSGVYQNTLSASGSISVAAKTSYSIKYNANGGSGAPTSQTKWYGTALTLSSTKPSRTGYNFNRWNTAADGGGTSYNSGASYTANAAATLYAQWTANTYTVSYNANGGSGAPASQTKTYGVTLKLQTATPTKTNYRFVGWSTSASATTAAYAAGADFTTNANTTLYAVWELAYVRPKIYNLSVFRSDAAGEPYDEGLSAVVSYDFETTHTQSTHVITATQQPSGTEYRRVFKKSSGTANLILYKSQFGFEFDLEASYTITVTITDEGGSSSAVITLSGSVFPFDVKAGNEGVAFGKTAELGVRQSLGGKGVADFAYDAKFNQPVYGNVLGLNRLPAIPANAELNDYLGTGCWAIYSNAIAATITCGGVLLGTDDTVPPARACRFEVYSSTGEGIRAEQWSYLRQRLIPYNDSNPIWERDVARGADNVWRYYEWWKSNLTPAVSKNVYHEQHLLWGADMETGMYMTAGHTATLTEKISDQPNGVVLVFCYYNGATDTNWGWIARYVPKMLVELEPGGGHTFELTNSKFGSVGTKYLYINDGSIVGHADNNAAATAGSGITCANNKFVLRYVIGV